jgi:hypothetical protein
MNENKTIKRIMLLLAAAGICTMVWAAGAWADGSAGVLTDNARPRPVRLNSIVMQVNNALSSIVISEKLFEVMPAAIGVYAKTLLTDDKGNPVKLSFFKKGQRVVVIGIELPAEKRFIAEQIHLFSQKDRKKGKR